MTDETQNPLLEDWTGPFDAPPFARIEAADFLPAFDAGFAAHKAEIAAIANNPAPPTFENTISAFERSGKLLGRLSAVFFNLAGADTSEAIEAIERDVAPRFAAHDAEIHLNDALFARIDTLWRQRVSAWSRRGGTARAGTSSHRLPPRRRRPAAAGEGAACRDR